VDHPDTDLIAVLRGLRRRPRVRRGGDRSGRGRKPVLLLTVGGSEASIRGAQSHTGALTSDTAVSRGLPPAGIHRVASPASSPTPPPRF
jgi:acyl-CoA synthetase (NDP forming)